MKDYNPRGMTRLTIEDTKGLEWEEEMHGRSKLTIRFAKDNWVLSFLFLPTNEKIGNSYEVN